ncbi:LysR family transcriptional regulator [Isoptericola halotolerans]|uniref:DNA-binding transcriptional LysR family regulator n=1 Tax=Isoptericola halotolerans TaxID=300560 RepID=A0ABX2A4E7_9MICO|nr:LysR family transcriptional regulator [Isoptericola halotolerans]NOV96466.1 DNA-binding transcriptional LysR family regulator [Isoptericola halotolerans]
MRSHPVSPDHLLCLLAVARTGRFTLAADSLGVNHTTVSRTVAALERALGGRVLVRGTDGWELTALGERAARAAERVAEAVDALDGDDDDPVAGVVRMTATDAFSALVVPPAVAALREHHPALSVEVETVTRRPAQHRSGVDVEVVVGTVAATRAKVVPLGEFALGMYAARRYLARHGTPTSVPELARHGLVHFIDSMLQVDDLDAPRRLVPGMVDVLTSTNVFVHVEATRAGVGLGFLPCLVADRHDDLVRVCPDEVRTTLSYHALVHPESWRRPAVAAVVEVLVAEVRRQQPALLGLRGARGSR